MLKSRVVLAIVLGLTVLSTVIYYSSASIGNGQLYVYIDSEYAILAHQDEKGFYEVFPGQEVYIQIAGITEFGLGETIIVKIGFEVEGNDYTYTAGPFAIKTLESGEGLGMPGVGDENQIILWQVGEHDSDYTEIPPCNTITVHYKDSSGRGPDYVTYDVTPPCITAHLHVIPLNPAGTLGAIVLVFLGFGVFLRFKSRKLP